MAKTKYQERLEKKLTDSYCIKYSVLDIAIVLRKDQKSVLWEKRKSNWTIGDWKEFIKIKTERK
jgi:hypothetical protein